MSMSRSSLELNVGGALLVITAALLFALLIGLGLDVAILHQDPMMFIIVLLFGVFTLTLLTVIVCDIYKEYKQELKSQENEK